MKAMFSALLIFLLAGPLWAQNPEKSGAVSDPESTLHVAAHYLDHLVMNAFHSLKLIASTPEARRGDWNGIKPYLQQLQADLPGVYFYVLPNGDYYSVALDFTNLNLSNRPYFKSLFAGNPVKGFPVQSRSSGRKSAVIAVPVIVGGKVTGALGTSIFLDELNAKLNRDFDLPADYTWYVLNAEGNTLLDKERDYIFMNPLTQGSPSLRKAVSEALNHESGTMEYWLGRVRHAHYRKLPNLEWWMFLARIEGPKAPTPPKLKLSLEHFVPELQQRLDGIDGFLARLIGNNSGTVANEEQIRTLLRKILDETPDVIDAAFVDAKGILRYIEPRDYKNFEGSDINSQEHIIAMRKHPGPLLSGGFTTVQDFLAMVVARPLYDGNQRFIGAVTVLIRPEHFIEPLLKKSTIPEGYELWIMQTDGMIIYDPDKKEIGKMLFQDPMYAEYESLLSLGRKIAAAPAGKGSYIFLAPGHGKKVIKNALWRSVGLHNRQWRVVLTYRPYE